MSRVQAVNSPSSGPQVMGSPVRNDPFQDDLRASINLAYPQKSILTPLLTEITSAKYLKRWKAGMTHASISPIQANNLEQQEFIGDKVLGVAVAGAVNRILTTATPEESTNAQVYFGSATTQAKYFDQFRLGKLLSISEYAYNEDGTLDDSIRSDVFEAFVGNIYVMIKEIKAPAAMIAIEALAEDIVRGANLKIATKPSIFALVQQYRRKRNGMMYQAQARVVGNEITLVGVNLDDSTQQPIRIGTLKNTETAVLEVPELMNTKGFRGKSNVLKLDQELVQQVLELTGYAGIELKRSGSHSRTVKSGTRYKEFFLYTLFGVTASGQYEPLLSGWHQSITAAQLLEQYLSEYSGE